MSEQAIVKSKKSGGQRKYFCDFDFFKKINTEEKAYWLGFIYADGCVLNDRMWCLVLSHKDKDHLYKLKESLKATYPVKEYTSKHKYNSKSKGDYEVISKEASLRISSLDMVKDLEKLGVVRRKTFVLKFPTKEQVPDHLLHHFVRGYFDGDGCVSKHKNRDGFTHTVGIVSAHGFLLRMLGRFMMFKGFISFAFIYPYAKSKGISCLTISANDKIHLFKKEIYRDATVFLERKKEIFDRMPYLPGKTKNAYKEILHVYRDQEPHCVREISDLFIKKYSYNYVRQIIYDMHRSGQIEFYKKVKSNIFYIWNYEEPENDPLRFAS